jgi:hypothetical protein
MTATIIRMNRPAVEQIGCSACGATTDAACDCGVAYLPARQRAAEAITANPDRSDRAIAAEIGVDHKTVGAARRSVGEHSPPEKRIGQDGKSYPAMSTKASREKASEARFDGGPDAEPTFTLEEESKPATNGLTVTLNEEWREPLARTEEYLGIPAAEYVDFILCLGETVFNRKFQKGLTSQIECWLVDMHGKYPDTFNAGSWEGSCGHLSIDKLRAKYAGVPEAQSALAVAP